jgi:hypothetical protein
MQDELRTAVSQALNSRSELEHSLIAKAWEDETFRQEFINDPKTAYKQETGQELPEDIQIEVIQETPRTIKMVLPKKPAALFAEEELTEEALESVAGGILGINPKIVESW